MKSVSTFSATRAKRFYGHHFIDFLENGDVVKGYKDKLDKGGSWITAGRNSRH